MLIVEISPLPMLARRGGAVCLAVAADYAWQQKKSGK
jgi:hypothetical protein